MQPPSTQPALVLLIRIGENQLYKNADADPQVAASVLREQRKDLKSS